MVGTKRKSHEGIETKASEVHSTRPIDTTPPGPSPVGSFANSVVPSQTSTESQKTPKKKRKPTSKTFFGCDACRSRRIRCDLKKPSCTRCLKAKIKCPGYGITLWWLSSPKFTKSGDIINSSIAFKSSNRIMDESSPHETLARRRLLDFVKWDTPYEAYDDMDRDLMILDNSETDDMVSRLGNTKLLGPFGVFSNVPPVPPNRAGSGGPSSLYPTPLLQPKEGEDIINEQLWLANELRDDALLTAAALGGDSHLLDFMNITLSNSQAPTPSQSQSHRVYAPAHAPPAPINAAASASTSNEFLNLLFHKNHATVPSINFSPVSGAATPGSTALTTDPLNLNLALESTVPIDPTNQHLYYSNYNNYFYDNAYKLNETLEIHLHASFPGDGAQETTMPSTIMSIVQSPLLPKLGFNLQTPANSAVGLPATALQVQPLTRYLLNHYVTHVADLMTVLPLTESPWKTIYFPRALMALGELSALGKTSTAKNALLNALLAVLAFNLQSKFPKNSDSMKFYLNLGIRLRNQASLFIRQLLGSSNDHQLEIETCLKNEKYKDVLCAVMSMISVDLVWGTMQDTSFYIKWCGKVISTKMQNKRKLSTKARILHRIFSSLKIIQDLTCLQVEDIKADYKLIDERGYDINGENFLDSNTTTNNNNNGNSENTTPLFINKKLINTKNHNENFATDALYGLPNSLIKLFARTVQLLRRQIYHQNYLHTEPQHYTVDVERLGDDLSSWTCDWKLYEDVTDTQNFYSPMHEVTYHHIMSFYYGLSIYFSRIIKQESPTKLQDKVRSTLYHLNSIQKLIVKENVGIIPLFWQGFIAGCEAVGSDLQLGYKKWGADISQYLGSYWGARQIMLEVWRRKRLSLAKDDWVGVINDWEMNLMLN